MHNLYLKNDGSLWAMGFNSHGQLGNGTTMIKIHPYRLKPVVTKIAAGGHNSLYLKVTVVYGVWE